MQLPTPFTRAPWPIEPAVHPKACWIDEAEAIHSLGDSAPTRVSWILNRVVTNGESAPLHHPTVKRVLSRPRKREHHESH